MASDDDPPIVRMPSLVEVRVDESVVVYDPGAERSHLLNSSAASIWAQIDDSRSSRAIADLVLATFPGEPERQIRDGVTAVMRQLSGAGLVVSGNEVPPRKEKDVQPPSDRVEIDPDGWPAGAGASSPPRGMVRTPTFGAMSYSFAVEGPASMIESLHRSLRTLEVSEPPDHIYTLTRHDDGGWGLALGGGTIAVTPESNALGNLLVQVNYRACSRHDSALLVHASGVLTDGGVVVLAGSMNAGKSTLVTGLVRAGYPYVSDEAIAVDLVDLQVRAYPKPIALDQGSYSIFPELGDVRCRFADQRWWINPLDVTVRATVAETRSAHPVAAVVFVQYGAEQEPLATRLATAEAVLGLTRNLFNLKAHGLRGLETANQLVQNSDAFSLRYSSLDQAVDWITATFARP